MLIPVNLTGLPEAARKRMHEIFTRDNERELIEARARQERIARFYSENQPKARDGFGGMSMSVDPYWLNYWKWHLGSDECWNAEEFTQWLLKKEPMFRVKSKGTRTQVGYAQHGAPEGKGIANCKSQITNPKSQKVLAGGNAAGSEVSKTLCGRDFGR
jgi:hypothetical protein